MTLEQTLSQLREQFGKMLPAPPAMNEASVWQLPIPARFIIYTSGIIRDAKADPDYRYRPDPSEALTVAKSLGSRNR